MTQATEREELAEHVVRYVSPGFGPHGEYDDIQGDFELESTPVLWRLFGRLRTFSSDFQK